MDNIKQIANFIEHQFPDFYKEEGMNFIQFVKAYYEWEDERSKSRYLTQYRDIDDTLDSFLYHFQNEYMAQMPKDILGDKRLLQKHILDLYRAKGSVEGIRLVFRLLFNEEIEIYFPADDIFRLDASVFYEARYLEISKRDTNINFDQKQIWGVDSGATAIVENYERRFVNGKLIDILFLSNIEGQFQFKEYITYQNLSASDRPYILGSPNNIEVISSDADFIDGEELYVSSVEEGLGLLATVDTLMNNSTGIIRFELIDGGFGYSLSDTVINILPGANTTGSGALFEIGSITNTIDVILSRVNLDSYDLVLLDANTYANGVSDSSAMSISDINATLIDALEFENVQFGTIDSLNILSPGLGYDGDVTIEIYDPLYLQQDFGDYPNGNNAVIENQAVNGTGFISTVQVKDSGMGYHKNEELITLNSTGDARVVYGKIILGAVGTSQGIWRDTVSFVDSDKYLQDDDYYQEYSYEIRAKRKLQDYSEVLRKTVHTAGNKIFGRARIISEG